MASRAGIATPPRRNSTSGSTAPRPVVSPPCGLAGAAQLLNPGLAFPVNYGGTFPVESFYWGGNATITPPAGRAVLSMAVIASFANGAVIPGDQVTFGRIRVRVDGTIA